MKDGEEEDECRYHMDILWHHLSKVKGGDGRLTFPRLSKVSKLVITVIDRSCLRDFFLTLANGNVI